MHPTNNFRWLRRANRFTDGTVTMTFEGKDILQQWWEGDGVRDRFSEPSGEWRDVEVVEE